MSTKPGRLLILGPYSLYQVLAPEKFIDDDPERGRGIPVLAELKSLQGKFEEIIISDFTSQYREGVVSQSGNLTVIKVPVQRHFWLRSLDCMNVERKRMIEVLRTRQFDVIHAHWSYEYALVGIALSRITGKKLVLTLHDNPVAILRKLPSLHRAIRLCIAYFTCRKASSVIFVSRYLKKEYRKWHIYNGESEIIGNFTMPNLYPTRAVEGRTTILAIGSSAKFKNMGPVLEAFKLLHERRPDWHLEILGPGLDNEFMLSSGYKSLSEYVDAKGRLSHNEVLQEISRASLVIFPSLEEAQPLTILECMAIGVAVIGNRKTEAVSELIPVHSLLINCRRPTEIARVALELIDSKAKLLHMEKTLKEAYTLRHSNDTVMAKYLRVFERLSGSLDQHQN